MPENAKLKTGTTTVGLVCADGVVLATDMRATAGHLIAHKSTQKLFQVDEAMGMTIAGGVGDAQALVRTLRHENEMYRLRRGVGISVQAASTVLANLLNQYKFAPFEVQLLVGGVDHNGHHLFSIDAAGGCLADDYITTGSGSVFVYGVLEDRWEPGLSVDDSLNLAIRGISASMQRDSFSGNGMRVAHITEADGFVELTPEEIDERRKAMGLRSPPA